MQSVLAFLFFAAFLQFLRGQLRFSERRRDEPPDEVEVNLHLLRCLPAALAVALMHKDFLDKLVEHGNRQVVEALILVNQSDKVVSVLFVLLVAINRLFQRRDFGSEVGLFLRVLRVQRGVAVVGQLA